MWLLILFVASCAANPGPKYPPTKGEVWPRPQNETKLPYFYILSLVHFEVKLTNYKCQILVSAVDRYMRTLVKLNGIARRTRRRHVGSEKIRSFHDEGRVYRRGSIRQLLVNLTAPCEDYPYYNMDERYNLTVFSSSELTSDSIWGTLAGLETFAQLFYLSDDYTEVRINATKIVDFPSYSHRGLLLDTSRHFISVDNILRTLDAMAINKMNVFHWHIVDDQSFPYQSSELPELSEKGAFYSEMVYTKTQMKYIIQYARDRGIRVLPEFDVPGHTLSWGLSHPEVLTECFHSNKVVRLGPLHPLKLATYKLVRTLYNDAQNLFPDKYFHIGGDEVDLECWSSNPDIQQYMKAMNFTKVSQVFTTFISRVLPSLQPSTTPVAWQEVFDEGVQLPDNAIIQVWKSEWTAEMTRILTSNRSLILSAPWYLDYLGQGFSQLYNLPPRDWVKDMVPREKLDYIVGGEACMWGEMVDDTNVISRVWPRASAVAELLWSPSPAPNRSLGPILRRAEEHTCRMRRRGVHAEPPAGPGFCVL